MREYKKMPPKFGKAPALHRLGFTKEEDIERVLGELKAYQICINVRSARIRMGGHRSIHMPETVPSLRS